MIEPDEFVTSDQIEDTLSELYKRLKLPFGRIEMQTGIKSRGIYRGKPSDIASGAAKNLFKNTDIKPQEVDVLIHASVCRDFLEPSTASVVHAHLGLRADCRSFDMSNACLGVVSAIELANDLLLDPNINNVLVVTGENSRPLIESCVQSLKDNTEISRKEIKKYFANFTIGSAGVALVLTNKQEELPRFEYSLTLSDTASYHLCQGDGSIDALTMETNSEELMLRGVELAKKTYNGLYEEGFNEHDAIIGHQVGIHHRKHLFEQLELDITKDFSTFEEYGNTGSAALPLTLFKYINKLKPQKGTRINLMGIGSGIHCTMMRLLWN